jgi:hypothetical protein
MYLHTLHVHAMMLGRPDRHRITSLHFSRIEFSFWVFFNFPFTCDKQMLDQGACDRKFPFTLGGAAWIPHSKTGHHPSRSQTMTIATE